MSKSTRGFTLIELMLAMTFLGALVLFGTLAIVQSLSIYNKGVAMKQIDQIGRTLIDDINRLSGSSSAANLKIGSNGAAGYMCLTPAGTNDIRAYVWSEAKGEVSGTYPAGVYSYMSPSAPSVISLAKTNEGVSGGAYCSLPAGPGHTNIPSGDITPLVNSQVRILSTTVRDDPANATLKRITFHIGTAGDVTNTPVTYDAANDVWSCEGGNLGNFCAIGKFETVIYTPND